MAVPVVDAVRWKASFPNSGVKAEVAYRETEKLRKRHGVLTAEHVVEAAASSHNALHRLFTWDDTEAARQFRLDQARSLLRAIHVVYKEAPETTVRAYEVVTKTTRLDDERVPATYGTTAEIMANPEQRSRLINEAIAQLVSWRRKFASLQELSRICDAIDETVASLK